MLPAEQSDVSIARLTDWLIFFVKHAYISFFLYLHYWIFKSVAFVFYLGGKGSEEKGFDIPGIYHFPAFGICT